MQGIQNFVRRGHVKCIRNMNGYMEWISQYCTCVHKTMQEFREWRTFLKELTLLSAKLEKLKRETS